MDVGHILVDSRQKLATFLSYHILLLYLGWIVLRIYLWICLRIDFLVRILAWIWVSFYISVQITVTILIIISLLPLVNNLNLLPFNAKSILVNILIFVSNLLTEVAYLIDVFVTIVVVVKFLQLSPLIIFTLFFVLQLPILFLLFNLRLHLLLVIFNFIFAFPYFFVYVQLYVKVSTHCLDLLLYLLIILLLVPPLFLLPRLLILHTWHFLHKDW